MNLLTKNELRQLIAEGETEETLEALQRIAEYIGDSNLLNMVLLQQAQFSQYKKERKNNITSDDELGRTLNRINLALLGIINDLNEPYQQAATDKAVQKNKQGSILYHFPNPMQLGEESKCTIRIAFEEIILKADWKDMEDTTIQSIRISDVMTVELLEPSSTPNFEIRSFNSKEQFIDKDDFTEWLFFVKPLRPGSFPLLLRVGVIELINERERRREIVLEETIEIVSELDAQTTEPSFKTADYTLTLNEALPFEREAVPPAPQPGGGRAGASPDIIIPAPAPTVTVQSPKQTLPPPPPQPTPSVPRKRRNVLPWIGGITTILLLALIALPILFTKDSRDWEETIVKTDNPFHLPSGSQNHKGPTPSASDTVAIRSFSFSIFLYESDPTDTLRQAEATLHLELPESGDLSDPEQLDSTGVATWPTLPTTLLGEPVILLLQSEEYTLADDTPFLILQDTLVGVRVVRQ